MLLVQRDRLVIRADQVILAEVAGEEQLEQLDSLEFLECQDLLAHSQTSSPS